MTDLKKVLLDQIRDEVLERNENLDHTVSIYADWLEEQGDPQSEEIRGFLKWKTASRTPDWFFYRTANRIREQASKLTPEQLGFAVLDVIVKQSWTTSPPRLTEREVAGGWEFLCEIHHLRRRGNPLTNIKKRIKNFRRQIALTWEWDRMRWIESLEFAAHSPCVNNLIIASNSATKRFSSRDDRRETSSRFTTRFRHFLILKSWELFNMNILPDRFTAISQHELDCAT